MSAARTFPAREKRHSVLIAATVERFRQPQTTQHRVRNLSTTGACVDNGSVFRAGETLVVSIGSLAAVGADVRWVDRELAGIRFTLPIEIEAALARTAAPPERVPSKWIFKPRVDRAERQG